MFNTFATSSIIKFTLALIVPFFHFNANAFDIIGVKLCQKSTVQEVLSIIKKKNADSIKLQSYGHRGLEDYLDFFVPFEGRKIGAYIRIWESEVMTVGFKIKDDNDYMIFEKIYGKPEYTEKFTSGREEIDIYNFKSPKGVKIFYGVSPKINSRHVYFECTRIVEKYFSK